MAATQTKNERASQRRWERQDKIYQRVKGRILALYLDAPKSKPFPMTHDAILVGLKDILGSDDYGKLTQYNRAKALGVHEAMHEWLMREVVIYTHVIDNRRVERGDPVLNGRYATLDNERGCYCFKLDDGRYLPMNADQRALDFSSGVYAKSR